MSTILRQALALLAIAPAFAQTSYRAPNLKTEVFGGFSTTAMEPGRAGGKGLERVRLNGWTVSATTYQFFRRWGLTTELSGHSRDKLGLDVSTQTYLFGGTYRSFERKKLALTGRILAGTNRWDPSVFPAGGYRKQNSFTFSFGQSIDVKLSERVAFRIQPDLAFVRRAQSDGGHRLTLVTPLSFGLAVKFGRR
ncbi:MAG: hypothetical protein K2X03_25475 [Bryobacteraceae bacterium]|nr:hypothetical protein [Bryobacteraceae bacterium]